MATNGTLQAPEGGIRRAPTRSMDDEDAFALDNEDEFLPSSADAPGFEEDLVKIQFDQDIEDARRLSQKKFSSESEKKKQLAAFVNERKAKWAETTWEGRNFLHYLAYYDYLRKPFVSLQWLMMRAIHWLPRLMGVLDKSKRTPLTVALSVGNEMFTHATCRNQRPETLQIIGPALMSECQDHDNDREITCLHTALVCPFSKEEVREERIKTICSFVPEQMFTVKDIKGRTPLHLAVEYERCCKTQVTIVEELLRRGPKALDVEMSTYSNRTMSVFQYHESSRRQAESKKKFVRGQDRRLAQGVTKEEREGRPTPNDTKGEVKKTAGRAEKGSMGPPPLPKYKGEDAGPELKRRDSIQVGATGRDSEVQKLALDTRQLGSSKAGETPVVSVTNPIDILLQQEEEREQAAKSIGEQLKLLYLRTQRPDKASHCLHVQDEKDKELWFDFGPPKKLTKVAFRNHFGHLQFDNALQYVAFPRIELDEDDDAPDLRHQGRKDMGFFFDWLRQKGVKRIVKVIVDDLKAPSHSDQAIEEALGPFDVEILDWRKLDLDPVSLARIGTCLREVHLQWSGRNTVLRSWSEKEGLATIPTLEVIHITQVEGLESDARIRENLDHFEKRLRESWPTDKPPKVNRPTSTGGRLRARAEPTESQSNHRQERSVDPHKWMQCMEEFASYFRQIRALRDKITDQALAPVQVALIDDGTDITHPDLKGVKFPGKSFHHYQEGSTWRVSPYWDSSSSHGTLMARLIHRICPSAVIHVIKLQTFVGEGSTRLQINPDSATQAIEYASEQGVEIISMSWTIKPPSEPAKKKAFDDAIHFALNTKGILMFCAASDQGKSADLTYPHGSNPNSFRIGAAKATGSMLDTVGDAHELSFIFPGHEVVIDRIYDDVYDKDFQKFEAHSGSSVATALAAALAALIVECVRLGVFYTNETQQIDPTVAIRRDDLIKIRQRKQMEYALMSIGTNRNTDNKYIEVWDTFSNVAESLKHSEGARINQLEVIAGLARLFLRKGV